MNNKGYIDIHSHLLYEIDDGAGSIEESVAIIKALANKGFSASFATPHNMPGNDRQTLIERCKDRINNIEGKLGPLGIQYTILCGAENYFDASLETDDPAGYFIPLGSSNTYLVEIPFIGEISHHIVSLKKTGMRCILAHMERYIDVIQNPDKASLCREAGFFLQMNIGSLIGVYGIDVMKTANSILQAGLVDIISTDIHDATHAEIVLKKGLKRVDALLPSGGISRILRDSPLDILNNRL